MDFDSLVQLAQVQVKIFNIWLVVVAIFVPYTPWFLFSLSNEEIQVVICTISKHFQELELILSLYIRLNLQALCAVDDIFGHADFQAVLNYVIVEAPSVEISLLCYLVSDTGLDVAHLFLLLTIL